jgi:hypothetical protein
VACALTLMFPVSSLVHRARREDSNFTVCYLPGRFDPVYFFHHNDELDFCWMLHVSEIPEETSLSAQSSVITAIYQLRGPLRPSQWSVI